MAIYSAHSQDKAIFPATLKPQKGNYDMRRLSLALGLSLMLSGCVTATLATAVVKTTPRSLPCPLKSEALLRRRSRRMVRNLTKKATNQTKRCARRARCSPPQGWVIASSAFFYENPFLQPSSASKSRIRLPPVGFPRTVGPFLLLCRGPLSVAGNLGESYP